MTARASRFFDSIGGEDCNRSRDSTSRKDCNRSNDNTGGEYSNLRHERQSGLYQQWTRTGTNIRTAPAMVLTATRSMTAQAVKTATCVMEGGQDYNSSEDSTGDQDWKKRKDSTSRDHSYRHQDITGSKDCYTRLDNTGDENDDTGIMTAQTIRNTTPAMKEGTGCEICNNYEVAQAV